MERPGGNGAHVGFGCLAAVTRAAGAACCPPVHVCMRRLPGTLACCWLPRRCCTRSSLMLCRA